MADRNQGGPLSDPSLLPFLVAGLLLPAVLGFAFGGVAVGFLLGGLTLGALVLFAARARPEDPIAPGEVDPGAPVLAVAIAPIADRGSARRVIGITDELHRSEVPRILVLAPVEPSAAQRWLSLRGTTREQAQAKLDQATDVIGRLGAEVSGEIVDEDPAQAVEDQAAVHGAAAIVFVVSDDECADEIEEVRSRTERPVHVVHVEEPADRTAA